MERYPCDPNCVNTESCPVFRSTGRCHTDTHHLYYPKRRYQTPTEITFRELDAHKVTICRDLHNELHAQDEPPEKPRQEQMLRAIGEQATKERDSA